MRCLLIFIFAFFFTLPLHAQQEQVFPRFASLRSDLVYMRAGPGERFPIEWEYRRKDLPVQIIDSFEHWYKIEDFDQTQGWIHKRMLSARRTALTQKDARTPMYKGKQTTSKILAYFDGQVIVHLIKCKQEDILCYVRYNDTKGYILRKSLFGIYPKEEIKE